MSDDQSCIENASRCCSGTSRAIRGAITEQSLKTPKTRALVSYLESSQYRSVEHASQPEWNPKDSQREAVHDQLLLDSFERSTLRDSTALNGQELRVSSAHSGQYLMPVRPMFPRNGDEMDSLECSPLVESLKVGWTRMNRVCDFPFDRELDRAKNAEGQLRRSHSFLSCGGRIPVRISVGCLAIVMVLLVGGGIQLGGWGKPHQEKASPSAQNTKSSVQDVMQGPAPTAQPKSGLTVQPKVGPAPPVQPTQVPVTTTETMVERSRHLTLKFMQLRMRNDLGDMWEYLTDDTTMHVDLSRASPLLTWYVEKDFKTDLRGGADITRFWGAFPTEPEDIIPAPAQYDCFGIMCTVVSTMERPLVGRISSSARASWNPSQDVLTHIELSLAAA